MGKKKLKDFVNSKGGKATLIGTSAFLLFGITCFIVGYGIVDGWDKVIAWFGSRWAILVYIAIGLWVMIVMWIIYLSKNIKE